MTLNECEQTPPHKYKPTEVERAQIERLKGFKAMVPKDFARPGPYPTYVLTTLSKLTATSTNPFPLATLTTSDTPEPSYSESALPASSTSPHAQCLGKYNFLLKIY